MERRSRNLKKKASLLILTLFLLFFVAAAGATAFLFFESETPQIALKESPEFIGNGYELNLKVTAPLGQRFNHTENEKGGTLHRYLSAYRLHRNSRSG